MILSWFRCRTFRSFSELSWAVPLGISVLEGMNGAGKTNLLEALVVFGNLTSFRPGPPRAWVQHGHTGFTLSGELRQGARSLTLEQRAAAGKSFHRALYLGPKRVRAEEYLTLFPVAALSTYDRDLILGGPETRRKLLDRLAFQLYPQFLDVLLRYQRALRQRNAALTQGHTSSLDAFDHQLAHLAAKLVPMRRRVAEALAAALDAELEHLGWLGTKPVLRYHAPEGLAAQTGGEQLLLTQLRHFRSQELARGCTLVGPHRHDLCITISGRSAREVLSAGQVKLLATGLRLAAVAVGAEKGRVTPLVAFDDVDAELDQAALRRLFPRLAALAPQVVVSTAHPELVLPCWNQATVLPVRDGRLGEQGSERSSS